MLLDDAIAEFDRRLALWRGARSPVWGTPTGIRALDLQLGGLQPSELVLIAGRPSMGKTALASQIAFHVARQLGDGRMVAFFSAEMPKAEIVLREVSRLSRIPSHRIRSWDLDQGEVEALEAARDGLRALPLLLDDTYAIPIADAKRKLKFWNQNFSLTPGLIVYDYIQLAGDSLDSAYQRVSFAVQGLREMARQYSCPVIALSQLSRKTEERGSEDRRPILSDLRDSGALENTADVVIFIYRPDYYRLSEGLEQTAGRAELIVAKARNAPTGVVSVVFNPRFTEFVDEMPISG